MKGHSVELLKNTAETKSGNKNENRKQISWL